MSEQKISEWDKWRRHGFNNGFSIHLEGLDIDVEFDRWLKQRDRERDAAVVGRLAVVVENLHVNWVETAVDQMRPPRENKIAALKDAAHAIRLEHPDASRLLEVVKLKAKLEENLPNSLRWNDLKRQIEQKEKELAEGSKTV